MSHAAESCSRVMQQSQAAESHQYKTTPCHVRFYRCVKFNQYENDYTIFEYGCPEGLVFDDRSVNLSVVEV